MKIKLTSHFIRYIHQKHMKIFCKLNLFTEITFQLRPPDNNGISCKLWRRSPCLNCWILSLSSSSVHLWYWTAFVCLSLNSAIVTQRTAIWGVKRPDVRGDVPAEIIAQPTLGYPACVAWFSVLLLDIGSSSTHPLDPRQHYLLQTGLGHCVEPVVVLKVMWGDEKRHSKWSSQTSWWELNV